MSDINHTITLGIGTPAGISEFLLFGLQLGVEIAGLTGRLVLYSALDGVNTLAPYLDGDVAINPKFDV